MNTLDPAEQPAEGPDFLPGGKQGLLDAVPGHDGRGCATELPAFDMIMPSTEGRLPSGGTTLEAA
ncbi:MAG: hypothetical protein ACUVUC_06990 [Thermoguttaceae bacterium]